MKSLTFTILFLSTILGLNAQSISPHKLWGRYFFPGEKNYALNICSNSKWYFTDCVSCLVTVTHQDYIYKEFETLDGSYSITDSTLELKDYKGDFCFLFKVVDSMNLMVLSATDFIEKGNYIHRRSSYVEGHDCGSFYFNDQFANWHINKETSPDGKKYYVLTLYSKPGHNILENNEIMIKIPLDSIYRQE